MTARVDGVDYTPEGIEQVRTELIIVRDAALDAGRMDLAVLFSHTLALLAELKERVEKERAESIGDFTDGEI